MAGREDKDGVPPEESEETMSKERRERTLTEAGKELYEERRYKLSDNSEKAWFDVERIITDIHTSEIETPNLDRCRALETDLTMCFQTYTVQNDIYQNFLQNTHTSESLEELYVNNDYYTRRKQLVRVKTRCLRAIRLDT